MILKHRRRHNPTRPAIARGLAVETFRSYYWYRDELTAYCRDQDLDSSGQKLDLVRRIEAFLRTGYRVARRMKRTQRTRPPERSGPLRRDTLVTSAFRCDAETRAFFKSAIGQHFHFTVTSSCFAAGSGGAAWC